MKALLIYQDVASAAKVNTALLRSAQNLDFAVQWTIRPWRVDMLKFPPTAEEALTDATDVHLIIFVGRCAQSFPFWLEHWLEHWAKCRHFGEASLGVIDSSRIDTVATAIASQLTSFAKCHGLGFVTDDGKVREDKMMSPIHVTTMNIPTHVPFNYERPSVDGASF